MKTLLASKDSKADADFSVKQLTERFKDFKFEIKQDGTRHKVYVTSEKSTPEVVNAVESMRLVAQEQPTRMQREEVIMGVQGGVNRE